MNTRPALVAFALIAAPALSFAQSPGGLAPLGPPPVPPENPMTEARILLGKALFWDEQLSVTGTVACGTCHRPAWAGTDPRTALAGAASTHPGRNGRYGDGDDVRGSLGVPAHDAAGRYLGHPVFGHAPQVGGRKSPSVVNAAYAPSLFWDGRAGGTFIDPATGAVAIASGGALESQALRPLVDTAEMGHAGNAIADVAERIAHAKPLVFAADVPDALASWIGARDYAALFEEAFGTPGMSAVRIAFAIASYERTLVADRTPLDAELSGTPSLTPLERDGLAVYLRADCAACHGGALLADGEFHYLGVRPADEDPGRFAQTGDPRDLGAFRTPSLRDVAQRPPYMHDGRFATLEDVVDFYDRGGDFTSPDKDPRIRPLRLSPAERSALLAFLRRPLTDARVAAELPPFDRPTLFSETSRAAVVLAARPRAPRSDPTVGAQVDPARSLDESGRAGFETVGAGTPLHDGRVPRIVALEPPRYGRRDFTLAVADVPVDATVRLQVCARDPSTVPAARAQCASYFARATPSASGLGSASIDVPLDDPALRGRVRFARFVVEYLGARATTATVRFTVFGD